MVKNAKYASLHEEVQPLAFWLTKTRHMRLSLKISGASINETIQYIEKVYGKYEKKHPFSFSFLDESLDELYKAEEKQAQLIFIFSMISILISIVGALGLILFMCEYRVKEIGIRKVNGSSILGIVYLLNRSFIKWVFIAFIIATPLSFLAMRKWLEGFAYKTSLSWWIFALSGVFALIITFLTVSLQSWQAASKNPVESLRNE